MALRDPYLHARFPLGELYAGLMCCPPCVRQQSGGGKVVHLADYNQRQAFADTARAARVEVIRYASVRDPGHGMNLALLTCRAFANSKPIDQRTWHIRLGEAGAQAVCEAPKSGITFDRRTFAVIFGLQNCAGLAVPIKRDGRGRCLDAGAMRSRVKGRYQLGQHRAPNQIIHLVCHVEPGSRQSEQTRPFGIHRFRAVS
jgi:RES domain